MNRAVQRVARTAFGLATSPDARFLFAYRRWASERQPYKSQLGQDWWVDRTLGRMRGGFFLDLAAADGVWISNTHFLEKRRGWDGICIEPNPELFAKLVKARSVTCIDRCISDRKGAVEFRVDNPIVGGIVARDTDNKPGGGGTVLVMQSVTLTSLLDELGAPRHIHYFSLDVEGAEDRVLRGLDLDRYSFELLTIERPSAEAHAMLSERGYLRVRDVGEDAFYRRCDSGVLERETE